MANERARSLRKNRTSAETRLWWQLRMLKAQGWKFRQQAPIDHFIVDFVCLSQRLLVEVDGGTHCSPEERARDARRERYLRDQGFRVMRFWNSDVFDNIERVMDHIVATLEDGTPPPPPPPRKGEGR